MKSLKTDIKEDFIYEFMRNYGIPKATISRIKTSGNVNLSKIPGQIILRNKLLWQTFDKDEKLLSKIKELKDMLFFDCFNINL